MPWLAGKDAKRFSTPLVMIEDHPEVMVLHASLKKSRPEQIVAIRVPAHPAVAQRAAELVEAGAEVIHLVFDSHGLERPAEPSQGEAAGPRRHVRDVLRDVHGTLVRRGIRDVTTLVASGGIALAEHVAKAIICGADLVAIDLPLVLALECRLCGECQHDELCPIALEEMDAEYGVHRIVNLMGAWHQQLIEVLGAMGIREVPPASRRDRPFDVLRGPRTGYVWPFVRKTHQPRAASDVGCPRSFLSRSTGEVPRG